MQPRFLSRGLRCSAHRPSRPRVVGENTGLTTESRSALRVETERSQISSRSRIWIPKKADAAQSFRMSVLNLKIVVVSHGNCRILRRRIGDIPRTLSGLWPTKCALNSIVASPRNWSDRFVFSVLTRAFVRHRRMT